MSVSDLARKALALEAERDKLKAEVERLLGPFSTVEVAVKARAATERERLAWELSPEYDMLQSELEKAELQVNETRQALFDEVKGVACGTECAGPGYRECGGCDARAKKALGLRPGQSIYDFAESRCGVVAEGLVCNERMPCQVHDRER